MSLKPEGGPVHGVGVCPTCGKQCFTSKANAKKAARQFRGRQGRLNAYRCGQSWHLGHVPAAVIRGDLARTDLAPRRRKETR